MREVKPVGTTGGVLGASFKLREKQSNLTNVIGIFFSRIITLDVRFYVSIHTK